MIAARRPHVTTEDPLRNQLLLALPAEDCKRLSSELKQVVVQRKEALYHPGDRIEHVYFPNGGIFSITAMLPDGSTVEAATVGDEGMIGLEAIISPRAISPGEVMLQIPDGPVSVLPVEVLRRELDRRAALYDLLGSYAQTVIAQMMQLVACNALHVVQERCARWLLMTQDRVHRDEFHLSHELLAVMLGARRQTVTVIAKTLQEAGLIRYRHGLIRIVDRQGLEAVACPCYSVIRSHFARLLPHYGDQNRIARKRTVPQKAGD
jgi:CRP-like cAMP-binding protein